MLAGLGFPRAEYRRRVCDDNRICVTMLFNTLTLSLKGRWQDNPRAFSVVFCPECSFFLDCCYQGAHRGPSAVEDAVVAVFPYHPWREQSDRSQALVQGLWSVLSRGAPPVDWHGVAARRWAGQFCQKFHG